LGVLVARAAAVPIVAIISSRGWYVTFIVYGGGAKKGKTMYNFFEAETKMRGQLLYNLERQY
jgi:hypothetical protein